MLSLHMNHNMKLITINGMMSFTTTHKFSVPSVSLVAIILLVME